MRRYQLLILVLFAILAIEGCRRGSSVKREPLKVGKESDYLQNEADDWITKAEPKKPIDVVLEDLPRDKKGFKFPEAWFKANVELRWPETKDDKEKALLEAVQKQFEAEKEQADIALSRKEIDEMGLLFVSFCDKNPPPKRSAENFWTHVRRERNKPVFLHLKKGTIQPIMEADPKMGGDVLGYFTTDIKEQCAYAFVDKKGGVNTGFQKKEYLDKLAGDQRLKAIHRMYIAYYKASSDRSYDKFKSYLKENLAATAYEAHMKREIVVLDPAKLPPVGSAKLPPTTIACYTKKDDESHLGITFGTAKAAPFSKLAEIPPDFMPDK